nr:hypothetical protein [Tanacetum cinerariifolium]
MIAARSGADPEMNARLRLVVEQAKKASMPRETLERAIKKGAGLTGEHVHFEKVTYEGFAPHKDVEAGDEGVTLFYTEPTDLDAVCKALPEFGFTVESAKIGYRPKNPVEGLSDEQMAEVEAFLEAIDSHDDVQNVPALRCVRAFRLSVRPDKTQRRQSRPASCCRLRPRGCCARTGRRG